MQDIDLILGVFGLHIGRGSSHQNNSFSFYLMCIFELLISSICIHTI